MARKNKNDFIGFRINKNLKSMLKKKANEMNISLSKLIDSHLTNLYIQA